MATLGTMRARIADELNRSDIDSQIDQAIESAIDFYEDKDFWFNEAIATTATVDGTEYYSVPSDYIRGTSFVLTVNGTEYTLKKRTNDWINQQKVSTTFKSFPTDYAEYNEQFRLYPVPNGAYTLTIYYSKVLTSISGDSDSNEFTGSAEELIRSRAKWSIYTHLLRDIEGAQLMKACEVEAYRRLQSETDGKLSSGRVKAWGY